jgi:prolipoprotein diacylglyceryltransferase
MYPNLYYAFKDLFGVEWNWLKVFNSFGFFVAIAFIVAAWILFLELKRKQALGLFTYTEQKITVGQPAGLRELFINFIFGFLVGYKLIGILVTPDALNDSQSFILSAQGSVGYGILVGLLFLGLKWWDKNKTKLAKPEQRTVKIWPHDRVGDLVIYAVIFGFLGAKIFDNLEHWNSFVKDPVGSLLSFSGLTFYGGLICAALAIYFYSKKHNIPFIHLCDAIAPALILAYAIGRIGCQVAGDGDWGILNIAFVSDASGNLISSNNADIQSIIKGNENYYSQQFATFTHIQSLHVQPFWGLPNWLFGYNYPHNVVSEGMPIYGCNGMYCYVLPISVFPTAFYEVLMCLLLFIFLWILRKKILTPGKLFGIYLMVNGLERFFIEKIRVNTKYSIAGFHPTQAELISSLLVIAGIGLIVFSKKWFVRRRSATVKV